MNIRKLNTVPNLKKGNPLIKVMDKIYHYKGPFEIKQVDEKFYRSSNFKIEDLPSLTERGIQKVVDLRTLTKKESQKLTIECEKYGIKFENLPINIFNIKKWLPVIADKVRNLDQKTLYHCTCGMDRTGTVAAIRDFVSNGLPMSQAITRMREHGYHKKVFFYLEKRLNEFGQQIMK